MRSSTELSPRQQLRRAALIALGCTLGLTLAPMMSASVDSASLQPMADKAPALPVTATFEKLTDGTVPPYVLKLKNDSKAALKVSGKVLLSVAYHSSDKARKIAEQVIAPGQTMTVTELAAQDRVILTAEGFAALELTVK